MSPLMLLLVLLLLGPAAASAQTVDVKGIQDTNGVLVQPGDAANNALRVNVVVGGGTGGTSSTFGAAFPGSGTAVGFKDSGGTLMQPGNLDASGNLKINCATGCAGSSSTALLTGQQAVTTSCVALPAQTVKAVTVQSDPDNTAPIYVGPTGCTTGNAYKLLPGSVTPPLALTNVNEVFVVAASTGQTVIWLGSN